MSEHMSESDEVQLIPLNRFHLPRLAVDDQSAVNRVLKSACHPHTADWTHQNLFAPFRNFEAQRGGG